MKLIPLSTSNNATKNKNKYFVQVDDEDYDFLIHFNWHVHIARKGFYAVRRDKINGKAVTIQMHRQLLGLINPKEFGDHIDRDGLNNQRYNLRKTTPAQNTKNRGKHTGGCKYLGVSKKREGKWSARICVNYKLTHIGYYNSEIEAAKARDLKAIELHGEFASLNFPELKLRNL